MSQNAVPALAEALALFRAPRGVRPGPDDHLPDGMFLLLRLAAGEEQALAQARELSGEDPVALRASAAFYIQQVLFASTADSYRVLGVEAGADDEKLREHYRWLARWLHPDRNRDEWEAHYAERVNQAWNSLRTPERRERYDAELSSGIVEAPEPAFPRGPAMHHAPLPPVDGGMSLRWLPGAIFGSLGVAALAVLLIFTAVRYSESQRPAVVASAAADGDEDDLAEPMRQRLAEAIAAPPPATVLAAEPPPEALPEPMTAVPEAEPATVPVAAAPALPVAAPARAPATERPAPTASMLAAQARRSVPRSVAAPRTPEASAPEPAPAVAAEVPIAATAAPAAAAVAYGGGVEDAIDQRTANRILGNLSAAYSDGDLRRMRGLFTSDAVGPGGGLASILAGYGQVFANSNERSLEMRNVSWFTTGPTLTIVASYDARVSSGAAGTRKTHGDIRLDLRKQGEQWRIFRLKHDERPG